MTLTKMIEGAEKRYGIQGLRPIALLSVTPGACFLGWGILFFFRGGTPVSALIALTSGFLYIVVDLGLGRCRFSVVGSFLKVMQ
jgi:hypothetical protein